MHRDYLQNNACRGLFRLEEGEESGGDVDEAGKVDAHLLMESGEVDLIGLGKVVHALDSGIEVDAVQVRVSAGHGLHEFVQVLAIGDIVRDATSFIAVLADKFVGFVLSTTNGNDFGALADKLLCHAEADA